MQVDTSGNQDPNQDDDNSMISPVQIKQECNLQQNTLKLEQNDDEWEEISNGSVPDCLAIEYSKVKDFVDWFNSDKHEDNDNLFKKSEIMIDNDVGDALQVCPKFPQVTLKTSIQTEKQQLYTGQLQPSVGTSVFLKVDNHKVESIGMAEQFVYLQRKNLNKQLNIIKKQDESDLSFEVESEEDEDNLSVDGTPFQSVKKVSKSIQKQKKNKNEFKLTKDGLSRIKKRIEMKKNRAKEREDAKLELEDAVENSV